LNSGLGSFKVIENTIRNLRYSFLFAFHSNCGRIIQYCVLL